MKILQILSSAKGEHSVSTKLADAIVEKLKAANEGSTVTVKDLVALQPHHLNMETLGAFSTPGEKCTPAQKEAVAFSDKAIAEMIGADIIVVAIAFYNYSVPSALKAWIDHVSRARITFKYNEQGQQVGLLKSKPVYVAIASGGIYKEGQISEMDYGKKYFALAMKMIGLTDVHFFVADGLGIPVHKDTSLQNAIACIAL